MSLRLRPRNAWEALDLGLALVRSHARAVYAAWFAVYLPAAIVVLALFHETPFWGWLLLWWLKPLFDRVVLEVLARSLFGESARVRPILASLPSVAWRSGIVGALTWRRFDLARSYHLPVYQLERLSGKAARQRIRILDREGRGAAVWLTFMLANLEGLFGLAASLAIALFNPVRTPINELLELWFRGQFGPDAGSLLGAVLAAFAVCAVEPFYVACGFTLYLQRRTVLEGWDIELRFRHLAARIESARRASGAIAASLACLALACAILAIAPASPARAADAPPEAAREIRKILQDREFGHVESVNRLKYVGPEWKSTPSSRNFDWSWVESLGRFLAEGMRFLAWAAGAAVLAFILYHLARYLRLHGFARQARARPDFLFGLDVRPESLPDDVSAAAESVARAGRIREALSLLYRGALVRFMDEGLEFLQGDTEGDCMRRVDVSVAARHRDYFRRLVAVWQTLAYGHRPVAATEVAALAREWRTHFPPPGEPLAQSAPQAA